MDRQDWVIVSVVVRQYETRLAQGDPAAPLLGHQNSDNSGLRGCWLDTPMSVSQYSDSLKIPRNLL